MLSMSAVSRSRSATLPVNPRKSRAQGVVGELLGELGIRDGERRCEVGWSRAL